MSKFIQVKNKKNFNKVNENFNKFGYAKLKLLSESDINFLKNKVQKKLNKILKKNRIKKSIISSENYHKFAEKNIHKMLMNPDSRFISLGKSLETKLFKKLRSFIQNLWGHTNIQFAWIGELKKKKQFKHCSTGFRIARPIKGKEFKNDVTGLHVDKNSGGLLNNDSNRLFTIWIPLIGFSKKYTLNIAPGSHKKNHSKYTNITKKKITILISGNYAKNFKFKRPNMKIGEVLLLNSNLLHGSSLNSGNKSRLSLDCRVINQERFSI